MSRQQAEVFIPVVKTAIYQGAGQVLLDVDDAPPILLTAKAVRSILMELDARDRTIIDRASGRLRNLVNPDPAG